MALRNSIMAVLVSMWMLVAGGQFALGQEIASKGAMLGSPDFKVTPDSPIGWRGDGTGLFPTATPPTQWGRTIKGFFSELQCQGGKPASDAKGGELLNMGFIRDWVIVGPFDTKDADTAMVAEMAKRFLRDWVIAPLDDIKALQIGVDEEPISGEATLTPQTGDKAGDNAWTKLHISVDNQSKSNARLSVDFALTYGKTERQEWQNHPGTMEPWMAFAQTSIWSPADGKVRLYIAGEGAVKAWLNGARVKVPGQWDPTPTVELKKGWNNLVVKCVASRGGWSFMTQVSPVAPYEYETKNIQWMTRMPGPSWCSPIIVGDKIFVSADGATLVCMSKADGKVLWMRSSTYLHAVSPEEQGRFPDLAVKVKQIDEACLALPDLINADITADGAKADKDAALNKKIKDKCDAEGQIVEAMGKADKSYLTWGNDADTSKYVPVSDGKNVWALFIGGNKGLGANVVVCYDMDGTRKWSYFTGQTNISEHGTHSSPALCGEYLIVKSGDQLFGLKKLTGEVAWKKKIGGGLGASMLSARFGAETIAYVPQYGLVRPSDGALLWNAEIKTGTPTPVIADGMLCGVGSSNNNEVFFTYSMPDKTADAMSPSLLAKASIKDLIPHMPGTFTDSIIGSPLLYNGLYYIVTEGAGLTVIDAKTAKLVYTQKLDSLHPRLTWVFVVGICSSPTLGGKYIFIRDDQGQTLVIDP